MVVTQGSDEDAGAGGRLNKQFADFETPAIESKKETCGEKQDYEKRDQ